MLKYISKRIIYLIPVLIGIVFLVFTIMYFSPGDPAKLILGGSRAGGAGGSLEA